MMRTVLNEEDDDFRTGMAVWKFLKGLYVELTTRLRRDNLQERLKKYYAIREKAEQYILAVIASGGRRRQFTCMRTWHTIIYLFKFFVTGTF
ncbi:hypothetical protein CYMTET_31925 [Cymbomonas tetramitiformis]|uniref:Uncharacterized protein n=1 Tax=Cymbomonas tetramitiformis TaxID=36881 RepID=A0AAE0FGB7_9CHLO|nr:hypothetical protein CYMTET_31925 [Cymbomonas tetramitiformis]